MKNTELEMFEGMRLHREMQSRQASQIAKYAGGITRTTQPDGPAPINLRRESIDYSASSLISSSSSSSSLQNSRRASLNWKFEPPSPSRLSEVINANDYIPPLEGNQSDGGISGVEDDGGLFDFLFD